MSCTMQSVMYDVMYDKGALVLKHYIMMTRAVVVKYSMYAMFSALKKWHNAVITN